MERAERKNERIRVLMGEKESQGEEGSVSQRSSDSGTFR